VDGADATARVGHRLGYANAFVSAADCYWLSVFPQVRRELHYWRARAARIPDPILRQLALDTHESKWCNLEGAAAFATLAPRTYRYAAIRLLVTFQAAYDYADTLSERSQSDPIANGRRLHQPLLVALQQDAKHPDYYLYSDLRDDGGYLKALTESCREAFEEMPSRSLVEDAATRAAERIVTYQSLNHCDTHGALGRWAEQETPPGTGLWWWEVSAACASSLTALALLSAAAEPTLTARAVATIEHTYHPWVGALHTLLDSLVDWHEDELADQPSLLDHYSSLTERMQMLVRCSRKRHAILPYSHRHAVLLAGMVGVYLAASQARPDRTAKVIESVHHEMGWLIRPTVLVMGLRRTVKDMWGHLIIKRQPV
jgi:tetraprenyl-beta-curcumene synthase